MKTNIRPILACAVISLVAISHAGRMSGQAPQPVNTWAPLGAIADSRTGAASVALADGRTLIAGGAIAGTATASIVVYNPLDNSFAAVGQLSAARVGHTASLLQDGRVLMAGGAIGGVVTADLELFDPADGTSSLIGTMGVARAGHGAATLADGSVLLVGGSDGTAPLATAEVFDPASSVATATLGSMATARSGMTATRLIDGRVLVAGGFDGTTDLASAEIFHPFAQTFEPVATPLSVARSGHAAILLPHNNSVLIAGGTSAGVAVSATDVFLPAEFPDPYTYGMGAFAPAQSMAAARAGAVGGPMGDNGFAFVAAGGSDDAERYRFATIKTDRDDYAPGERAVITGSGWQPDEIVTLRFQEDPAVHQDYVLEVQADLNGEIYWDQWAPDQHDLGVRFYLLATGAYSRAQITFTDNVRIIHAQTVNPVTVNVSASQFLSSETCNIVTPVISLGSFSLNSATATQITASNTNGRSVRLIAPLAADNPGYSFTSWSSPTGGPFVAVSGDGRSICIRGSNGNQAHTYTPNYSLTGPTKLAYTTAAFSGAVNTCLGTITVQTQNASNAPTNVTTNTTVNLATDASSSGGAGAFYSDAACTAAISSVSIPTGSNAASFYYKATTRGTTGQHQLTASASGLTSASQTQTINKAEQTITFAALADKTYGDAPFAVSATASSGLTVSFASQTPGVCSVSGSTVTLLAAGSCTIQASQGGDGNYNAAPVVDRTFTVHKAATTTVVSCPAGPFIYSGLAQEPCTATVTGAGGLDESVAVTYSNNINAGTATASATFAEAANYLGSSDSETFEIGKAPLTITASSHPVTYGDPAPTVTASYSGFVNGETEAVLTTAPTCTTTYTSTSAAGSAQTTSCSGAAAANYEIAYVGGTVTVNQKPATITASDATKTYGQAVTFAGTEFSVMGLINGDAVTAVTLTSAGAAASAPVAGSPYPIVPSAPVGTGLANYIFSFVNGQLTVNAAPLTITASSHTVIYGDPVPTVTASYSGFVNGESESVLTALPMCSTSYTSTSAAGSAQTTGCTGAAAANYAIGYAPGTVTVNQKPATVTANDATKSYGQTVTFVGTEFTASGFINGDAVATVTLTSDGAEPTATVAASPYPIVPSAPVGTGLDNYVISFVNGALAVTAAPLTITASSHTVTYGDPAPTVTAEYDGFVNGESASVLTAPPTCTTTYTSTSAADSAQTTTCSGAAAANYEISYVGGTVTVSRKPATITANSRSKTYGQAVTFDGTEFTPSGFINSDTVTHVTLTSDGAAATATVAGSPYAIVPSAPVGSGLDNYVISLVDGALTVMAAPLTITASSHTVTYGDAAPAVTATYGGFVNGESEAVLTALPICTTTYTNTSAAGSAQTTSCTGAAAANYGISYVAGTVTVNQKPATITANDATKTYGDTVTFAGNEFMVTGLINGDDVDAVTLTSDGAAATATVAGSPYAIVPSAPVGTGLGNYAFSFVNGELTVDPKALTVTANDRSKVYGDTVVFAGTEFGSAGLVNGDTVDSVTLTSAGAAATAVVAGSPYPIVPSNAVGARVANYTITYVNGGLTVNTKPLTITADSRSKVYGATATFAGTEFTVAGLVNGDSVTSVTLASPGAAATATVAGSPYAIVPSSAVGAGLANYAITYVNGVLTVTPATLTVTAKSASRPFGTPNPDVAGPLSIVGYVNGENASVLTALPTCATTATLLSPVGSYPVTCGGAVAANYEFVYVNGTLSVGAWHLTGFYQPVGVQNSDHTAPGEPLPTISDVWNSIKGGQTVPLKFELFVSQGGAERTSVTDVASFTLVRVGCSAGPEDPVEPFPTSGATQLRYDLVDGQFIQNWQSPKGANQCYRVTMTALDGSSISAFFKTK